MEKNLNLENVMPYQIDLEDLARFDEEIKEQERKELQEF